MPTSVRNIGRILDLFTPESSEWTVAAVAAKTGMPKANVYNLMSSLSRIEILEIRGPHRYRIGRRLDSLRDTLLRSVSLRLDAWPHIDHLVSMHGETCHLAVLDRWRVIYVANTDGRQALMVAGPEPGTSQDARSSAVGKVLLANRPNIDLAQSVTGAGDQLGTCRRPVEHLRRELVLIERLGYALDLGLTIPGVSCVAAPVTDATGDTVAALALCAPQSRFSSSKYKLVESTMSAAKSISGRISHQ